MSGVAKGIGKVFKSVGKVVKKIAPIALMAGAALVTGGAALPGLGGALGIGGAAASAGTAAAAGSALGGGAGLTGLLGKALASPIVGNVVSGLASGMAESQRAKNEEERDIREEERVQSAYRGLGGAMKWDAPPAPQQASFTQRQGLGSAIHTPRIRYDRESGQIVRA